MRPIDGDNIGLNDIEIVMCEGSYKKALEMLIDKINNAPTVDAVLVVRCRDCMFSKDNGSDEDGYCCFAPVHNKEHLVMSGDYCSYGRRREDNGKA